jgi:hypothetical protein
MRRDGPEHCANERLPVYYTQRPAYEARGQVRSRSVHDVKVRQRGGDDAAAPSARSAPVALRRPRYPNLRFSRPQLAGPRPGSARTFCSAASPHRPSPADARDPRTTGKALPMSAPPHRAHRR